MLQTQVYAIICGTSWKRKNKEPSPRTSPKKQRELLAVTHLIIDTVLHHNRKKHRVKALLDTGCSITLISNRTTRKLAIFQKEHKQAQKIENYTGEEVPEVCKFYTEPLLVQHRKHYTRKSFEVLPMDPETDIFLPFGWILEHPPPGAWTNLEIQFNSRHRLEKCTRFESAEFSLTMDESVASDPEAHLIRYILAA